MHVSDSNSAELKTNKYYGDSYQEKRFMHSMVFRVFALLVLLALLYLPVLMMEEAFVDHFKQQQNMTNELSKQWGNEQKIAGPILSIPYVERISKIESQTDSKGITSSISKDIFNNKTLILLPENLRINANLKDKILTKDNIETTVFEGDIELSGNFNLENLPKPSAFNSIEWDKAFLAMGVSNNISTKVSSPLRWEGSSAAFKPGTNLNHIMKSGFHANLEDVANDAELPQFRILLNIRGNHNLSFAPMGESTTASIKSESPTLEVQGNLAATSTVRTNDSFEAIWRISNLVRNYPQEWLIEKDDFTAIDVDFFSVLAGVNFNEHSQTKDSKLSKIQAILPYLIPILGVIFLSILIFEFKRNSHSKPKFLHYLVISLSVLSIPIILLTIKDLTSFEQAYQIAAGTSIVLIVIYMMSALKSFFKAFYILLIIASLYGALYVHLQMPEYNLFALSAAGLFITILLMMASINIHEDE